MSVATCQFTGSIETGGEKASQKHLISRNTNTFNSHQHFYNNRKFKDTPIHKKRISQLRVIEHTKSPYHYTSRLNAYVSVGRDSGVKARDC